MTCRRTRKYALTLSGGRVPTAAETTEFFSPPLAYGPAAVLAAAGLPPVALAKAWQGLQVVYAGLILLHLKW